MGADFVNNSKMQWNFTKFISFLRAQFQKVVQASRHDDVNSRFSQLFRELVQNDCCVVSKVLRSWDYYNRQIHYFIMRLD
jgi:hypothetical protein